MLDSSFRYGVSWFRTPILLVDLLFSEFDSANCQFDSLFSEVDSSLREFVSSSCQFDSSAGLFDLSFYEFDSSLTTSVRRRLSFCRFVISSWRFIVSTRPPREAIIRCALHEVLFDSSLLYIMNISCIYP